MKKVGFIGACDKTNLIMYVAKTLQYLDKKVLVVDTTLMQKSKYVVPAINPTKSYVTDFEDIDFAVGFENMIQIMRYIGLKEEITEENIPYDYVLIDIDNSTKIEEFDIQDSDENYFVTTFDMYSLRRGVEILSELPKPMKLVKVLYNYNIKKEDEEYLNYISIDTKAIWKNQIIYLPMLEYDNQMMEENQRFYKLKLKKLTAEMQEGIYVIVQDILREKSISKIKRSVKE